MRRKFIVFISLFLGTVLFILTLRNVGLVKIGESLSSLKILEIFFALITLFLGLIIVGALRWRIVMKMITPKTPPFSKFFLARWVGYSISYLTPSVLFGGEPIRFYLLKGGKDIPSTKIISSIIIDKLIVSSASLILFFAGIFFILFYLDLSWLTEQILFGLLFLSITICCFLLYKVRSLFLRKRFFIVLMKNLYLNRIKFIKKNQDKMREVEEEIVSFFRLPKKRFLSLFSWTILEISLFMFACWLVIFFTNQSLEIPKLIAIKGMIDFSYMIPVPLALGVLEVTQAFVFQILGFSLAAGVAFSLAFRGLNLIIVFFGLLVLGWFQVCFLGKKIINFFSKFLFEEI